MKVENMTSARGNKIANQFIVNDTENCIEYFQSYESVIVKRDYSRSFMHSDSKFYLDETYWDYSVTTSKYRNQFLGETKKETQAKIDSGEYQLVDLN